MPPGRFCVISRSRPDSLGGGGGVAEIFHDLQKGNTFAGGGSIFRDLQKRTTFAGGGGG